MSNSYVGADGLLHCEKCKGKLETVIRFNGITRKVKCICSCKEKEVGDWIIEDARKRLHNKEKEQQIKPEFLEKKFNIPCKDNKDMETIGYIKCDNKKDYDFIAAAIRKAHAEKPIDKYTRYDINGEYDGDFCKCPNCKKEIIDGFNLGGYYNYCPNCGQKIDWSEADD